ncbi:MAG: hypothetical protein ACRD6W_10430 [Nitrososphaerales archaeon]
MRRWSISESEVLEALAGRESTRYSSTIEGRRVVIGYSDAGRRLKIVTAEEDTVVVTVAQQGRRR